jgi:hypothetical protein
MSEDFFIGGLEKKFFFLNPQKRGTQKKVFGNFLKWKS